MTKNLLDEEIILRRYKSIDVIIHPLNFPQQKYIIPKDLKRDELFKNDFLYNLDILKNPIKKSYFKRNIPDEEIYVPLSLSDGHSDSGIAIPAGLVFAPTIAEVLSAIPQKIYFNSSAIEIFWPQEVKLEQTSDVNGTIITVIQAYKYQPSWWQRFKETLDSL